MKRGAGRTLWTGDAADAAMLEYTAGSDREWDSRLLAWDILGSLGHVEGLAASELLTDAEHTGLQRALRAALRAAAAGRLRMADGDEDVHTAVENWLTRRHGRLGQLVHTGRSRNDQVACDLRLFLKSRLLSLHGDALAVVRVLLDFADRETGTLWPGYSHTRAAMPSSGGLWAGGLAEGLLESLAAIESVWVQVDRSPLGSAAGYGVPLPLLREASALALGFSGMDQVVTSSQNSRGRLEAAALFWCAQLGQDLARLSSDVILFSAGEYGFLRLPGSLVTGSSIMPQKKNPDLFELTRARAALVDAELVAVLALRSKLTSGYHRDFQFLKEPLFRGLDRTGEMLRMMARVIPDLEVDRERAASLVSGELLATDEVMRRVEQGEAFRQAYRAVARELGQGKAVPQAKARDIIRRRRSTGSVGRPGLRKLERRVASREKWQTLQHTRFYRAMSRLAGRRWP